MKMKLYYITELVNDELVCLAGPLYNYNQAVNAKNIISKDKPDIQISEQIVNIE